MCILYYSSYAKTLAYAYLLQIGCKAMSVLIGYYYRYCMAFIL